MTPTKRPRVVLLLALLWPLISIAFLLGLRTDGEMFDVPNWFHDGLKPFGVVAYLIATWWLFHQVRAMLLGRKAAD